ncbi:flagellar hook-length control protein FliK [Vogesella facilis]|uniref:Flagellar hook-length control protein FliK n=1 Tax=Vogesella facilis TaxID=1655232 RepID=A0ABV7RJ59_9NEIS
MLSTLPPASNEPRQAPGSDDTLPAAQPPAAGSVFAELLPAGAAADLDDASAMDDGAAALDETAAPLADATAAAGNPAANLVLLGAGLLPLALPTAPLPAEHDSAAGSSDDKHAAALPATRPAATLPPQLLSALPAVTAGSAADSAASHYAAANLAAARGADASAPHAAGQALAAAVLAATGSQADNAGDGAQPVASSLPVATALPLGNPAPAPAQWAPLKLPAGQPAQWAQPLQQALGERLRVQAGNGIEQAVIRLDPPHLGSLEIAIRHEAGSLQVQLSAGNGELLRQLHAISDNLRQGLGNRQYGEVAVWVADSRQQQAGHGGQQRQGAPREQRPGQALYEAGQGNEQAAFTLA